MPIGEIFALVAAASWAVGSLLFARIGTRVAPGAMNLGKCVAAAVVLSLARAALSKELGPIAWPAEAALLLAASGLVGLTIGDTAYFGALVALGVPRAILLLSAAPVFATLGGVALLGEHVGGREALGIGLTLGGIALVVAGRLVTAAIGLAVLSSITGHARPWVGGLRKEYAWLKVAGASLIGTVGGIWLSQLALARCASTGVATTLLATSPIFALPLAHFVGHERITARGVAGTLLAIGGVVLLSLRV